MSDCLIDTDILIDHLRGYAPAREWLRQFEAGQAKASVSTLTFTELAAGKMTGQDEEQRVRALLALFEPVDVDPAIAWRAGEIKRQHGTRLADAVIAATALQLGVPLYTRNLIHFTPVTGLQAEKPYA
jgi:predicted nucleic acid-binding protein